MLGLAFSTVHLDVFIPSHEFFLKGTTDGEWGAASQALDEAQTTPKHLFSQRNPLLSGEEKWLLSNSGRNTAADDPLQV